MDKLPKSISDKLQVYDWKRYAGDNPIHKGFWAKKDRAIKIVPARKMTRMFHVQLILSEREDSRFISLDELELIIEN